MKTIIDSKIFIKIIKGELSSDEKYKSFYEENDNVHIVTIDDCIITGKVIIENFKDLLEIVISNSVFRDEIAIYQCYFYSIKFENTIFDKSLELNQNLIISKISLYQCEGQHIIFANIYADRCYLNNLKFQKISLANAKISSKTYVHLYETSLFIIGGNQSFFNEFELLSDGIQKDIFINDASFNKVLILNRLNKKDKLYIDNIYVHQITFHRLTNLGELILSNIKVNKNKKRLKTITEQSFLNYTNEFEKEILKSSNYYHHNLFPFLFPIARIRKLLEHHLLVNQEESSEAKFMFSQTYLGKCSFRNFPLDQFSSIHIQDTSFSTLRRFNCPINPKIVSSEMNSLYEFYNELYVIASSAKNKEDEILFYKAAKDALLGYQLTNFRFHKTSSLLSLISSKIYSNHGVNWLRALCVTIIFGSTIYASIIWTVYIINGELLNPSQATIISKSFEFLNPLHSYDFHEKLFGFDTSQFIPISILDAFGRLLVSIGTFETILAFRKYSRKN